MTEQPPSAGALHVAETFVDTRERWHKLARRIDALCEQRVCAETERCALVAENQAKDYAALYVLEGFPKDLKRRDAAERIAKRIRAPAERPAAPPQQTIRERIEYQRKIITKAEIKLAAIRSECKHGDKYRTHNMDLVCRDCGQRW